MNIGKLTRRIELQRINRNAPSDRYGQRDDAFETYAIVWASVNPLSGRELTQARQRQSLSTHTIRIRYRGDTDGTCRAKLENRVLNFESVICPDEAKVELVITAIEQATGAEGSRRQGGTVNHPRVIEDPVNSPIVGE